MALLAAADAQYRCCLCSGYVTQVQFADNETLLSSDSDGQTKVWDIATGEEKTKAAPCLCLPPTCEWSYHLLLETLQEAPHRRLALGKVRGGSCGFGRLGLLEGHLGLGVFAHELRALAHSSHNFAVICAHGVSTYASETK